MLQHGLAISYDGYLKPCCVWTADKDWKIRNHITTNDLSTWHQLPALTQARDMLAQNQWPDQCVACRNQESQGRSDSIRLGANRAYEDFTGDDITLEIRPGTVCNFACQICWPEASSRVRDFYQRAGVISITGIDTEKIVDFGFLDSIAHRLKNVVILGGEPFYDRECRRFLAWAADHLDCNMIMFTNGSMIDWDWVKRYHKLVLVFSLDAIDRPAEYIRFGTEWSVVRDNLAKSQSLPNIDTRVNVTISAYNFWYVTDLMRFLARKWPSVVTFGHAESISGSGVDQSKFDQSVIPDRYRLELTEILHQALDVLHQSDIPEDQRSNAINAIKSELDAFDCISYNAENHKTFVEFVRNMDRVKHINVRDYCPELARILDQ